MLLLGVPGHAEIDFGDGSAKETKSFPPVGPVHQVVDVEFQHKYVPGQQYTIRARVFRDDIGSQYEVITRTIYFLPAHVKPGDPMPYPYHPFDQKRLKDRAASEASTT